MMINDMKTKVYTNGTLQHSPLVNHELWWIGDFGDGHLESVAISFSPTVPLCENLTDSYTASNRI